MKDRTERASVAEQIRKGLEEAVRHARGEITLKSTIVELPEEPPEIDAPALAAIRGQSRMSQAVFARLLNVSTKTVQSWEQGLRTPSHAARRLIQIYCEHPEMVCRSVGLPPVGLEGIVIEQESSGRSRIVVQATGSARKAKPPRTRAPR
ncbi:MAG: helix-turn-helix domain-containing protein [Isosphaeraceae bacterium]|nr:helix-turn-helix domain-containing protein [Isosphaeraceae bacterium]